MERLLRSGRHDTLDALGTQVTQRFPDNGPIRYLHGLAALAKQDWPTAAERLASAAKRMPRDAQVWDHLGIAQSFAVHTTDALESFRRSLSLDPTRVPTLVNLAKLQNARHDHAEAERLAREALRLRPGFRPAALALAKALAGQSQAEPALGILRDLNGQSPGDFDVLAELGETYRTLGLFAESVDACVQALAIAPDQHTLRSGYLFSLSNDERCPPERLFAEHREYGERVERPHREHWGGWKQSTDPDRPLTVGMVSGDLRSHVVSYFLEPLLETLDRSRIRLHAYYTYPVRDTVSDRLKRHFSVWRDVAHWRDDQVAAAIRADEVDILIDLSGHTAHNRLEVFARKPAPVQASMLGYPNTTGLTAMDYRLMGQIGAPPGRMDSWFSEHLATVPVLTPFRYQQSAPDVVPPPLSTRSYPTFASFNRVGKIGDGIIRAWAKILEALPSARLLIGNVPLDAVRESVARRLDQLGVPLERVEFRPRTGLQEYLAMHAEVDVLLDAYPYNGGTTNQHALWMGVPVVSMAGPILPSRTGANVLGLAGLGDWVVDTEAEYVARAIAAVSDVESLSRLRQGLRAQLGANPLRQPATAARFFEAALRMMWRRWCEGLAPARLDVMPEAIGIEIPPELASSIEAAASRGWARSDAMASGTDQ
ncbi:O-linked N-acetylglucosamine transferase, SPINDLY family protein [Thioalkalivibrio paradoxus]|uniref:O-linked N-acetylglucosamine transferase, SPINDLY family protein n=1 Tax=Thioalkalivibrio paradoxus TaxID=108010 RepID=UPI00046CACC2|nr:hypothetical protein [Thioalkalivibrio paradoxus]